MGGTTVQAPGGVPEAPPKGKTLREHRDQILAAFGKALDEAIVAEEGNPTYLNQSAQRLDADIKIHFPAGTIEVRPSLDLHGNLLEQIHKITPEAAAKVVDAVPQEQASGGQTVPNDQPTTPGNLS